MNAVFCEPVCNHVYSQKLTEKAGFVLRALEVDLMPAAAYEKEASAAGRVAALLTFRTFRPRPHPVHLPAVYQDALRFLYEGLDDNRDFRISDTGIPAGPFLISGPRFSTSPGSRGLRSMKWGRILRPGWSGWKRRCGRRAFW